MHNSVFYIELFKLSTPVMSECFAWWQVELTENAFIRFHSRRVFCFSAGPAFRFALGLFKRSVVVHLRLVCWAG